MTKKQIHGKDGKHTMLIDTTQEGVIRVTIDFFTPLTEELEYKLDYILDSMSQLESDYDREIEIEISK